MPVSVPGAAVSPGTNTNICARASGFTVNEGLVVAVMPVCVTSEAVTVQAPAVLLVKVKVPVPPTSAALAGKIALGSVEVMVAVSLVLITFQLASTALTTTV